MAYQYSNTEYKESQVLVEKIDPEASPTQLRERIVNEIQVSKMIDEGWKAADLHVHTWHSYDVIPTSNNDPLVLYQKAIAKGLRYISFTDHDSMDAYDQIGWSRNHLVPGVEIRLLDSKNVGHTIHVNVYRLNRRQFYELEEIAIRKQNLDVFIQYLQDNNLDFTYNHPFWRESGEELDIQSVLDISALFRVIEYNRGRILPLNMGAINLAERNNAGMVACTDTHIGEIGHALTLARGETFPAFFRNIKERKNYFMPQNLTHQQFSSEVGERLEKLFRRDLWRFEKPGFQIKLGISSLENLIRYLVRSEPHKNHRLKKLIKGSFKKLNQLGLPASLYLGSQVKMAQQINIAQ